LFLTDEAVSLVMKRMKECFICPPSHKVISFRGLEEDGGLMFLSEEAALQTDSSISIAFRLKQGF